MSVAGVRVVEFGNNTQPMVALYSTVKLPEVKPESSLSQTGRTNHYERNKGNMEPAGNKDMLHGYRQTEDEIGRFTAVCGNG